MSILRSASEARTSPRASPELPSAPTKFKGPLAELAERFIVPAFPAIDVVLDAHRQLMRHLAHPDALFLIRHIRGTERRHDYRTAEGVRFRATDNAPAWWMYAALRAGHRIDPDAVSSVIESMPCHMFDVAPRSAPVPNDAGWHIAHILNVNDRNLDYAGWTRREVVRRFVRNVHPANYFLLPKVEWQRLGNDTEIVDYFANVHRERYASIWDEFADLAVFDRPRSGTSRGGKHVAFGNVDPRERAARGEGSNETSVAPRIADEEREVAVSYNATRLLFKRDLIEPLSADSRFRVRTPVGDFEMSKADFHAVFPTVIASRSYRERGIYHFPAPPKRAEQFKV